MQSSTDHVHPPAGQRQRLILAVLAIAGTTFALLQAIVVPALPNIGHALGATPSGSAWILTAYLLSAAVLTPILGRVGDMPARTVLVAVMICWRPGRFCRSRLAAADDRGPRHPGAGGGVFPLAFGIVRDEFPRERVAGGIGLISSLLGIGAGLGLVVPGVSSTSSPTTGCSGFRSRYRVHHAAHAVTSRPLRLRPRARINWGSAALMAAGLPTC